MREAVMPFTNWNPVQACIWIASQDDAAVASLRSNHTFAELALAADLDDSDPGATVIEPGMTYVQLFRALDARPQKAKPAWIGDAQRELLRACYHGALKMTGRPLSGGSSQEIPATAFHGMEFYDELPHIAGEFENERSHTLIERLSSLEEGGGGVWMGLPDVARNAADCWINLRLQASEVRSVWPKDAAQTKRTAGAKPKKREAAKAYLREKYPDGIPASKKNAALLAEFTGETKITIDESTLRRALKEIRQNMGN